MANLAIKGHATRGKEVIEILEMLGGKNVANYDGFYTGSFYYIDTTGFICYDYGIKNLLGMYIYTLEEFLVKYPYKVRDKVVFKFINTYVTDIIKSMKWYANRVVYTLKEYEEESVVEDLQFYKEEETMEESTNKVIFGSKAQSCNIEIEVTKKDIKEIKINIPEDYKVFRIDDDNKIVLTKKQSQYPKTYEECEDSGFSSNPVIVAQAQGVCLCSFAKLIVLRGAYWKIAGEQMGLGKPWEPDWTTFEGMPAIFRFRYNIVCDFIKDYHCLLVFPTTEMRDDFYENFKDLIEQCKELL